MIDESENIMDEETVGETGAESSIQDEIPDETEENKLKKLKKKVLEEMLFEEIDSYLIMFYRVERFFLEKKKPTMKWTL